MAISLGLDLLRITFPKRLEPLAASRIQSSVVMRKVKLKNKHLVFVYGKLRRGGATSMSIRFPDSKFIADTEVRGSLYDLGAYPGLRLNESNTMVIGEAYEVNDQTLRELDEFEAASNYLRKQVESCIGGQLKRCWTYEPDPKFYSLLKLIKSGDWIEYARTKTDWL